MNLTAARKYGTTHILYDTREAVGADMRMSIGQDVGRHPMLTEHTEDFFYRTTFLGTRIELTVRVRTGTSFAK